MNLNASVFDVWVFTRTAGGIRYLLLETSTEKARRHFNGGMFWQIPSGVTGATEGIVAAIDRVLATHDLRATAIWAAEHAYTIYNRRFDEVQIITVFATEVPEGTIPRLNPVEHGASAWLSYDEARAHVHFRGLKEGLDSVREYITGVPAPGRELCLRP